MKKQYRIAIPSGSLFEATLLLFKRIGIAIKFNDREFMASVESGNLTLIFVLDRPQDIPMGIVMGAYDAGVCGWDCVVESGLEAKLAKIIELKYAKKSRNVAKVVVFGKTDRLEDNENILVATEYLNLAGLIFKKAKIAYSHGCTEAKVLYGGYDYGIGVTETGASLKANGLKIVATILDSPTILIAKQEAPQIRILGDILSGALAAEKQALLKFDCSSQAKEEILAWLPAIDAPTVSSLSNGDFAIETVLLKDELANQLIRLKLAGATGIIVQDFNILL
ncbi:MAG: ATP phosphoribosyltransferase [Patescibacteria group bacterium]|nr:ATP phosphoribosyltransferase [Patescibacteria group bacterium]